MNVVDRNVNVPMGGRPSHLKLHIQVNVLKRVVKQACCRRISSRCQPTHGVRINGSVVNRMDSSRPSKGQTQRAGRLAADTSSCLALRGELGELQVRATDELLRKRRAAYIHSVPAPRNVLRRQFTRAFACLPLWGSVQYCFTEVSTRTADC